MQGSDWFGYDELTLIFFVAFSWTIGMKNRLDLNYETVKSHRATWKSDTT